MSDYASAPVPLVANSQAVSVTTTSAASAAVGSPRVLVTVTALCFVQRGLAPTAVAGTSMALAPNVPYQLLVKPEDELAFVTATGTATAYITPLA